ncbi:MAG: hypothetical protein ABIH25_00260 [Candidatus Woesearchaeota archaeon]
MTDKKIEDILSECEYCEKKEAREIKREWKELISPYYTELVADYECKSCGKNYSRILKRDMRYK